jgi:hydrogenase maturation factor HypF (carbamoyltransferase family)
MSYQINLHAPVGVEDFSNLSKDNFVSKTRHDGGVTITDIYYQPKFAKNTTLGDRFLNKVSGMTERLKGYKFAGDSASTAKALINIKNTEFGKAMKVHDKQGTESGNFIRFAMHELAKTPSGEVSSNGTTFTLVNWTEGDSKQYQNKMGISTASKQDKLLQEIDKDLQDLNGILKDLDSA